ncbi:uncharacterized protein LOC136078762 [Hydra vulgaris]|uniref:Uncharacterized protein LOC136078762 n=1 Tax=Hydra vulgaris TaxID=6087 RepID=A0ABM4BNG3_HYDVU
MIAPSMIKKSCRSRQTISPSKQLTVTLRYLATRNSQQIQAFYLRLGRTTVCNIINEPTKVIWDVLQPCYLKALSTSYEWEELANEFENEWNFPNCIGAIDGKHVCIEAPSLSGSAYYSYNKYTNYNNMATKTILSQYDHTIIVNHTITV